MTARPPAVAGTFYPARPKTLRANLASFLADAAAGPEAAPPKALIAPHAGYVYSGPVAASAYARLSPLRDKVTRVVLLGPSHFVGFSGLAVPAPEVTTFTTPLGEVPLDRPVIDDLLNTFSFVQARDDAHAREHSLEVQLPFLQETLDSFSLVPLVVGFASPDQTAVVLEHLWGGPETLIVISSDLSHYHNYTSAQRLDRRTAEQIVSLDFEHLTPEDACGCHPIQGLLALAQRRGLTPELLLDLRNSGDTAGTRDRVVGYGAFALA
ncbi:MAG: AmmeMemoRadiSam system protein B [Akkermansiaceae bacterium]|nr:AmmeMemoRadiSam system protein B [Akkermansiaceae bacterium]